MTLLTTPLVDSSSICNYAHSLLIPNELEVGGKASQMQDFSRARGEESLASHSSRSWDMPLTRAEKVLRVAMLYEAELNAAQRSARHFEREAAALERENRALRRASHGSRIASDALQVDAEAHSTRSSCFGVAAFAKAGATFAVANEDAMLLKPSLRRAPAPRDESVSSPAGCHVVPVQELQDCSSAVTRLCFGREREELPYILLAAAYADGMVVIYRCFRTEMETASGADAKNAAGQRQTKHPSVAVHARLVGHTKPVTLAFFSQLEDRLVTASADKSLRFWDASSGQMLKIFVAGVAVQAAALLPCMPSVFVATTCGTSGPLLRLVDTHQGREVQSVRLQSAAPALEFDDTGKLLFAGMQNGSLHVFEFKSPCCLAPRFEASINQSEISLVKCLTLRRLQQRLVLIVTVDSLLTIAECFASPSESLASLVVQRHVSLSFPSCIRARCSGPSHHIVSGCSDGSIEVHPLPIHSEHEEPRAWRLNHHQAAVVATAINTPGTLLASADASGRIVFWRCVASGVPTSVSLHTQ